MFQKTAALHNLGCKVNSYETEAMQQLLENAGYKIVPFESKADVYVVNTCTVTNIADRKSRQMLHKARKENPEAVVVAAGCYAQTGTDRLLKDKSVDVILGNNHKAQIVEVIEAFLNNKNDRAQTSPCSCGERGDRSLYVDPIFREKAYEPLMLARTAEKARVFIKVTDGCSQFCSYCLIPYARGRVRSRKPEDVVQEVKKLVDAGYQEVVLTGIHLSSYGTDFCGEGKAGLLELIEETAGTGVRRIRLGSLEPGIITEQFVERLSKVKALCPHFHLSLQSGCDATLERMNRRYRTQEYLEKCGLLRRYFPDAALTTDVIVGFPMETEEEFAASYAFVEKVGFYETHVFRYSRREGTKAAKMSGQVPEDVKAARSEKMIETGRDRMRCFEESRIGQVLELLVEEPYEKDGEQYLIGHSRQYIPVAIPDDGKTAIGSVRNAEAVGFLEEHLVLGRIMQ